MTIEGKTVLVTGGSKGIGRAVAEAMAGQGANVIVNYGHDENSAEDAVRAIEKHGVKVLAIKADITNQDEVASMFTQIKNVFPRIDILINNAGVAESGDPGDLELFRTTFETNLFAQVSITNSALQMMDTGKIIFTSSIHGRLGHGHPGLIAYSSSKAALESYMKNLAKQLAPDILVNAIAPGRTLTPHWGDMDEDAKAKHGEAHLTNRMIDAGEVADGAVFLAKNDAICGEVLTIDGGMGLEALGEPWKSQ